MHFYDNEWQAVLPPHVIGNHWVSSCSVYTDKYDNDFSTLLHQTSATRATNHLTISKSKDKVWQMSCHHSYIVPQKFVKAKNKFAATNFKNTSMFRLKRLSVLPKILRCFWTKYEKLFWNDILPFFVDDCHTPLPLSRGDLIKSIQILKWYGWQEWQEVTKHLPPVTNRFSIN